MNKEDGIYDLVIKNGNVISFEPDVILKGINIGIMGQRITEISDNEMKGRRVIDAGNKYVCPGFIDFHSHVGGKLFSAECVVRQGGTTSIGGERNFDGKLIRNISENGFLINHGFYISHSFTLRRAVGRNDIYSPATNNEIEDMKILAEQFFKNGSFGIHFGLEYVPGTSIDELIELSRVAKKYNRVVLIHTRSDANNALVHFAEVEKVLKETGASVHLVHLVYMIAFEGITLKALQIIRAMREKGYDITADTGLYAAYPNCIGSSILAGDWTKRYGKGFSEKNVLISSGIFAGEFCTKERFEYIRENYPATLVTVFACKESEIETIIREPYVLISSNSADGPHYDNVGHPETAGTFPKLISKYVREEGVLSLLEAIYKITWGPGKRFKVLNKGNIRIGYDADIVIFDYDKIKDCADYVGAGDPNAPPEGIDYVIVNGEVVCEGQKVFNNKSNGTILKLI